MSIYTKIAKVLAEFPQVRYVTRDTTTHIVRHNGKYLNPVCVQFGYGDKLQIGQKAQGRFTMSSAASYALANGECPIAAYTQELERGHPTHWITSGGSCISDHAEPMYDVVVIEEGEMIYFEGRLFTVHATSNHNMGLVAVDLDTIA
jgi:hypothetical protein